MGRTTRSFRLTTFLTGIVSSFLMVISLGFAHSAPSQEEVETLDMIEITSTSVVQKGRTITFSLPEWPQTLTTSEKRFIPSIPQFSPTREIPFIGTTERILLDQSQEDKKVVTPVRPLRAERPAYPRQAREKGWQGIVLLQLNIDEEGMVKHAEVKESSGYPILDSNALQTVKLWAFSPAKNGNFPVSSVVKLPIKFDLRE